jgi:oligopeptide/dipeptide ABC transporter ATP-binding protein
MMLLEVSGLKKHFTSKKGFFGKENLVRAVDGVSFSIREGETLGIVGESGCGKSTLGRSVLRLLEPTEGEIRFQGKDILPLKTKDMQLVRRNMQIVFQDPYASLNPRNTVRTILETPFKIHQIGTKQERTKKIEELIEKVGLTRKHLDSYPHEFSGGQRQRIGIARALTLNPKLIIADEPVSALDVSVQSQVLNLMTDLQQEYDLSYLFISHDLSVVQHISDKVAVMYLGRVVEIADAQELYSNPQHPYTKALLSAVPTADPKQKKERVILTGELPSPSNPPSGCAFHPRCPIATEQCKKEVPALVSTSKDHLAACIHV